MRLDELLPSRRHGIKKRKRHHILTNENEERGCAKGGLRRNEEEPELGEGCLPSPKQEPPRAPLSRAECEEQAAQRNKEFVALAETARGGCRG